VAKNTIQQPTPEASRTHPTTPQQYPSDPKVDDKNKLVYIGNRVIIYYTIQKMKSKQRKGGERDTY
jgi:hypothetical protein